MGFSNDDDPYGAMFAAADEEQRQKAAASDKEWAARGVVKVAPEPEEENPLEGRSAWYKKYHQAFPGLAIPCGCGVFFLPAKTKYHTPKPAPTLAYGIFLGYEMAPGGRGPGLWSGGRLTRLGTNPAASALRGRMEGRSS